MIFAWLGAAAVGLSLGLLGSGGAILTVPILVYLVGHDEKSAIAESLAIVGAIAVAGVIRAAMQKRVDFRSVALLAVPGMVGTYAGAHAAKFIPGFVQLVMLAVLMLTAAALMFRNGAAPRGPAATCPGTIDIRGQNDSAIRTGIATRQCCSLWIVGVQGVGLGLATGLVGVGGGFLIVPVLVLLRKLPMPMAIGTSLGVIAVNSATGFLKYISILGEPASAGGHPLQVDWQIIGVFAIIGVAGSLFGNMLAGRIRQAALKRIFAVFLVVMAGYIFVRQAPAALTGVFGHTPLSHPACLRMLDSIGNLAAGARL